MSLPTSRNTTYAPGSELKSADLNDLQDKIVDAYGGTWPITGKVIIYDEPSAAIITDFNPAGLSGASIVTVTSPGALTIESMVAQAYGRIVAIHNRNAASNITLTDRYASAGAGYQFLLTGANAVLSPGDRRALWYDDGTDTGEAGWRLFA